MTVFYTLDADGDHIPERADILQAETEEAALAAMKRYYAGPNSDFKVTGFRRGRFGDCWIKCNNRAAVDANREKWEAEAGGLYIAEPGQHPGGRSWWITPASDVLVPVVHEKLGGRDA